MDYDYYNYVDEVDEVDELIYDLIIESLLYSFINTNYIHNQPEEKKKIYYY